MRSPFLTDESKAHRTSLESDERGMYEYLRTNLLPASNFEESHKIFATRLQSLHGEAGRAFSAGVKLRAELEQLQGARGDQELRRRLALSTVGDGWNDLRRRYLGLIEQAAQLEARYGPRHPKLLETQEALNAVGTALDKEADTAEAALQAHVRSNASEQAQLRAAIDVETKKALDLRQKELEYNRLKRHLDEDRESYDLVAKRQKELEIQAGLRQSYVRRLDAATAGSALPRPIGRATALGLLVGLLLGVGLAFGLDVLDDTVRSPRDAEARMRSPMLGFVTELNSPAASDPQETERVRAEHIVTYPRSEIAEQCHAISTAAYSLFLERAPRTLAVVSSTSNDGKTLTSINLAATLSARGKRVLLIDLDLRRGRLHSLFKLPRRDGLFELATGHIDIAAAVRQTFIPNVNVICCGEVPDKVAPARVLELPHLREVLAQLSEKYDLLLFDTPPLPMVSDVLLLKDVIDGAIGVFRAGRSSMRLAATMERQLIGARVNFLGWVLNGVARAELQRRYYRRYGYGAAYEEPRAGT